MFQQTVSNCRVIPKGPDEDVSESQTSTFGHVGTCYMSFERCDTRF